MIKGIGCDIVDLNRLSDRLDEFACKILTSKEFEIYCNKKTDKQKNSTMPDKKYPSQKKTYNHH